MGGHINAINLVIIFLKKSITNCNFVRHRPVKHWVCTSWDRSMKFYAGMPRLGGCYSSSRLYYTITIFNRKGIPFYYKTLHPLKHVKTKNAFNFVIVIDH